MLVLTLDGMTNYVMSGPHQGARNEPLANDGNLYLPTPGRPGWVSRYSPNDGDASLRQPGVPVGRQLHYLGDVQVEAG